MRIDFETVVIDLEGKPAGNGAKGGAPYTFRDAFFDVVNMSMANQPPEVKRAIYNWGVKIAENKTLEITEQEANELASIISLHPGAIVMGRIQDALAAPVAVPAPAPLRAVPKEEE